MYKLIKPILFQLDPEKAHGMTINALKIPQKHTKLLPILEKLFHYSHPILSQSNTGIHVAKPTGLAAGFDKSCEAPKALEKVGFGSLELGGVTPKPQPCNPKPRMYRLVEHHA